jgi:hypothetical protein
MYYESSFNYSYYSVNTVFLGTAESTVFVPATGDIIYSSIKNVRCLLGSSMVRASRTARFRAQDYSSRVDTTRHSTISFKKTKI